MRRALALFGLLIVLAGCGAADQRAPFADSRIPPSLAPRFWAPEGWAWGLLKLGDAPAQRYGVAAGGPTPKASILILAGYGESAEAWFETVRDLNALGYAVWVLERAGQGGSERYVSPRDLGHVPSFDDDIATTRALARLIVDGAPERPLILLGHSVGGLVATAAVERDGLPIDGLILSAPYLAAPAQTQWQGALAQVGLGRLPAGIDYGWRRDGSDAFAAGLSGDRYRGAVQKAWQTANPDLRMGEPSLGWSAAARKTVLDVTKSLGRIEPPVLMLIPGRDRNVARLDKACAAMRRCTPLTLGGGRHALHLDRDSARAPWLAAVEAFSAVRTEAQEKTRDHGL